MIPSIPPPETCQGCPAFAAAHGVCRLLALPTPARRQELLGMACHLEPLLRRRFAHLGTEVMQGARDRWLDPGWTAQDVLETLLAPGPRLWLRAVRRRLQAPWLRPEEVPEPGVTEAEMPAILDRWLGRVLSALVLPADPAAAAPALLALIAPPDDAPEAGAPLVLSFTGPAPRFHPRPGVRWFERPRDARLFASRWPYHNLTRAAFLQARREARRRAPQEALEDAPAPEQDDALFSLRARTALSRLRRIDPLGHARIAAMLGGAQEPATAIMGWSPAAQSRHKALALYRFLALLYLDFAELPSGEAAALLNRRFTPGGPDEAAALSRTREVLGEPGLSLPEWRGRYHRGAERSLALLREALAGLLVPSVLAKTEASFRHVLGLPPVAPAARLVAFTSPLAAALRELSPPGPLCSDVETMLRRHIAPLLDGLAQAEGERHLDASVLSGHCQGSRDPIEAQRAADHLCVCAGGSCTRAVLARLLREGPPGEVAGEEVP